jgi:nucleotide-binding universal stress UspA family protein
MIQVSRDSEPLAAMSPVAPTGPVLVASDGDADVGEALCAAARMASGALGAAVEVVGVCEPPPMVGTEVVEVPRPSRELEARRMALFQADVARTLSVSPSGDPSWPVTVLAGSPSRTLAGHAAARQASLLVMGLGRHSPLDRLFGRETTVATLRDTTVPVLAVGPSFPRHPSHAVVGVDFGEASTRAAHLALRFLAPGGRLSLVHVAPRFARPVEGWERWDAEYAGTLPALFERLVARLDPPPEILVETVVLRGDPAATLLARVQQERAPLLAVGAERVGVVDRLLVGSVATSLLRTARSGMLVVRGPVKQPRHPGT